MHLPFLAFFITPDSPIITKHRRVPTARYRLQVFLGTISTINVIDKGNGYLCSVITGHVVTFTVLQRLDIHYHLIKRLLFTSFLSKRA